MAPAPAPSRPTTTVGSAAATTTVKPAANGVDVPGLYVVAPDGTGLRRLMDGYGDFSWSPDGTRLAYADGGVVTIVAADGSGRSVLRTAREAFAPLWSPDGTRIAFGTSSGGTYVARADGSGDAMLVEPDRLAHLYGWTPDGRLVVIRSIPNNYSEVVVYDLAGGRRVLAADAQPFVQPRVSPDGRLVAYLKDRIAVASIDGSGTTGLTDPCCASESVGSPLAWSPDSRRLAFIHYGDVWVVGADGSGDRVFVPGATDPAWSPDGRMAVIGDGTQRIDGKAQSGLQVVDGNGGGRRTVLVPARGFWPRAPAWSPTGRLIALMVSPPLTGI